MRRLLPGLLLSLLLARAAAAELRIAGGSCLPARAGEAWIETWAEVENAGDREVAGTLEVELVYSRGKGPRATREIAVAPGTKKRFHLLVYAGFWGRGEFEFRVVTREGETAARLREPGFWPAVSFPTCVILSPPDRRPSVTAALTEKQFMSLRLWRWEGAPERLPETWQGWTSAGLIVAAETDWSALSEEQRRAIREWVWMGGRILFLPGTDAGWLEQPMLQALAPCGKAHERGTPEALAFYFGENLPERSWGFDNPGEFLLPRAGGSVLAWPCGQGRAAICAFDANHPALRTSPADLAKFALDLIREIEPAVNEFDDYSHHRGYYTWNSFGFALGDGLVDYPPTALLILVLLAYVALVGPVNFFVLRRRHVPAWTVVTVPALGILTTGLLWSAGWLMRETRLEANRITVLYPVAGTADAVAREHVVVATGGRRTALLTSPNGRLAAMTDGRAPAVRTVPYGGPDGAVLAWPFEPREPAFFYSVGRRRIGAAAASLEGGVLTVVNETDWDFEEAILVDYPARRHRALGPIARGQTRREATLASNNNPFTSRSTPEDVRGRVLLSLSTCCFDVKNTVVLAVLKPPFEAPIAADGSPVRLARDTAVLILPVEARRP